MSADWMRRGTLRTTAIEWKARQLRDPVKKLAYLQRAARKRSSKRHLHFSFYLIPVLLLLLFGVTRVPTATSVMAGPTREKPEFISKPHSMPRTVVPSGPVWLVDDGHNSETYSNGLRVDNSFVHPNQPRSYVVFRDGIAGARQSNPMGIIFHTSESVQAPFSPDQNAALTRIGRELLEFVRRHRAYHFVIDRFGRVFRVVPETDSANHSGYSVWSDRSGVYVNLNHSFLGISFEAQTREIEQGNYLSASQINSGRLLVEMLVSKYKIPLENCVTHAQVSVDPGNMTIGYHYDGSGDFPFQQLGIPDNYRLPIPSLFVFGFDFDSRFLMYSGTRLWKGMQISEKRLRRDADLKHLPLEQHKENLRKQYWASIETLKELGIIKEN